jgi:hypothetical protein
VIFRRNFDLIGRPFSESRILIRFARRGAGALFLSRLLTSDLTQGIGFLQLVSKLIWSNSDRREGNFFCFGLDLASTKGGRWLAIILPLLNFLASAARWIEEQFTVPSQE